MDLSTMLADLRQAGWRVAVHNDYKQHKIDCTFWLFTHPCGKFLKGEGTTDEEAVAQVVEQAAGSIIQST